MGTLPTKILYGFASALVLFGVWYFSIRPLQNSPSTNTYATISNVHNAVNGSGFDVGRVISSNDISCAIENDIEGVYRNFSFEIFVRFEERFDLNVVAGNSLMTQGVTMTKTNEGSPLDSVFSGVAGSKGDEHFELFYTSNDKAVFTGSTACTTEIDDYVRYAVE